VKPKLAEVEAVGIAGCALIALLFPADGVLNRYVVDVLRPLFGQGAWLLGLIGSDPVAELTATRPNDLLDRGQAGVDRLQPRLAEGLHPVFAAAVPELVERHWYHYPLHNQRAELLKALLLVKGSRNIVLINVPWYIKA